MAKLRGFCLLMLCAALIFGMTGCRPVMPTLVIARPSATPISTLAASAIPTAVNTPAPASSAPPPAPTAILAPTLLDRYPLSAGMFAESIAVSPGRVWVGTTYGILEERDAASGALLQTYNLAPPSYDGFAPVKSILYDGKRLWALYSWEATAFDQFASLWVFDLETSKVVTEMNVSANDPYALGSAPGQVWAQNQVIDAETQTVTEIEMQLDSTVFAYDGAGVIWAAGAGTCEACFDNVYRYMVIDPANPVPGPHMGVPVRQILRANSRMWLLNDLNQLKGFDLHETAPKQGTLPALTLDLGSLSEDLPAGLVFDGQFLWLLSSYGADGTWLFRLDALTGKQISAIQIDRAAENYLDVSAPVALAFDGRDLWVLSAYELLRVALPWTR